MAPTRHILALGGVDPARVASAARLWSADKVNGRLCATDVLLALFDPDQVTPPEFIETLFQASELGVPVGVMPVYDADIPDVDLRTRLGTDRLAIDFSRCRFRLGGSPAANSPGAPSILTRAVRDDSPASTAEDVEHADVLFLQGHSGPVDGSFGRWLTLCSRELHRPGEPVFFPCAGTERCFRQQSQGRAESSSEGLTDPRRLRSTLVVADGCGTFPVPGSIYRYEQSLLRGLMLSPVQASVLSLGVSATPLSVVIFFMAMLARGRSLGEAVMDANRHRRDCGSPSSLEGAAAAPWILVGNPAAIVTGIPLTECSAQRTADGTFQLELRDEGGNTGTLVVVESNAAIETPLDVTCEPPAWAHGALDNDGRAYLWVGTHETEKSAGASAGDIRVTLSPRPVWEPSAWRDCLFWLRAGSQWVRGLADGVAARGRGHTPLLETIAVRDDIAIPIEQAVYAATPHRRLEIASGLDASTGELIELLGRLDRATAINIAAAVPFAGARLSHLWSPPWLHGGSAEIDETCLCGCAIVGHVRRHPLHDLLRIELSCPTCSLIGDAAAERLRSRSGLESVRPTVRGSILQRSPVAGHPLDWLVERLSHDSFAGFACATLFDPFRVRYEVGDAIDVPHGGAAQVSLNIPSDWPVGLAWATLIFTAGGRVSMFAFDVDVRQQSSRLA